MTTRIGYYDLSAIAQTSYVRLEAVNLENKDEVKDALLELNSGDYNGEFSESQADAFLAHWQIIHHQPNTDSGFSATLFQRIDDDPVSGAAAGDLVLAIRGTETGLPAIVDDLYRADYIGIVANGLAFRQIVDMYNYWQRLITPDGEWARQAQLVLASSTTPTEAIVNESGTEWTIEFADTGVGLGLVGSDDLPAAVAGHSLGGHLATAFSWLFPGWTGQAVTINGAGYPNGDTPGLSGNAITNITNLFAMLGGQPDFDPSKIENLYGERGPELVTMNQEWGLVQPGRHLAVYIEDAGLGSTFGHSASQMSDALAVYDLFFDLVPALQMATPAEAFGDLYRLAESASPVASNTNERLVNALADLFGVPLVSGAGDREVLYQQIAAIREPDSSYSQKVVDADNTTCLIHLAEVGGTDEIVRSAQDNIAARYALQTLAPFMLLDAEDVYSRHNQTNELGLYDPSTRQGMTENYLRDRAAFLRAMLEWNAVDGSPTIWTPHDPWHFEDNHLGIHIDNSDRASEFPIDEATRTLFGGPSADALIGGGRADALYGGDGADVLQGGQDGDYLEGGEGVDTYVATDNDRIFDRDGFGRVLFDDSLLSGGWLDGADGEFISGDGRYRYSLVHDDLSVQQVADGAVLTILNFRDGDLGIRLENGGSPAPVDYVRTIGSAASEIVYGTTDPEVNDFEQLNGYNLPDHISGGEGRDWIYAWDDTPQTVEDGGIRNSAPDTDIVEGGPGKDLIHGGAGDDQLYATELSDGASVRAGQGLPDYGGAAGDEGDLVSGGRGEDTLYGSGRLDGLFGGDGDDLIYGGGGSDIIAGDWSVFVGANLLEPATYDYAWYSLDGDGGLQLHLSDYRGGRGNDHIHAGEGDDIVWGGAADDVIYGEDGNDRLNGDMSGINSLGQADVPGAAHGDDYLSGGAGDDAINGNGGSDILLGGAGSDVLDGDFRVLLDGDPRYHGDDFLDGGADADILTGNGGSDVLLGGDGDDALFGDLAGLAVEFHGADVLYGGAGDDQLTGQGGNDTLHGGDGNDSLLGDDDGTSGVMGDDLLFGGSGSDQLVGGLGADVLDGGEGEDFLWGDAGDDRLAGGRGVDYLNGGEGADTYLLAAGDGGPAIGNIETIDDKAGEGNRIEFASDVAPGSLRFALLGDSGDLMLQYAETDAVYLFGGLTGSIEAYSLGGGDFTPFGDVISHFVPDAHYLEGTHGDDLVFGGGHDDLLRGDGGEDRLFGGAGGDVLLAGEGADLLIGGAGDDLLEGGPGSDEYRFGLDHARDLIADSSGFDILWFTDAVYPYLDFVETGDALSILRGGDSVTVASWRTGSVGQVRFADGSVTSLEDALGGSPNLGRSLTTAASIQGALDGTSGNDSMKAVSDGVTLRGGAGDDVYSLSPDFPATVIQDGSGDTTLVVQGNTDAALYLNQNGDDLRVVLDGATVATLLGGVLAPPERVITPAGEWLTDIALTSRINAAPAAGSVISPVTIDEDAVLSWRVPTDAFVDPDDTSLDLSITTAGGEPLPGWLSFDPSSDTLSGTPSNRDVGVLELSILASDKGGMTAETAFSITVANTNDAPYVLAQPGRQSLAVGDRFELDLAAETFAEDDLADKLRFSIAAIDGQLIPDWLGLDSAAGLLSGVPYEGATGQWDLKLTATDSAGAAANTVMRLVVGREDGPAIPRATQLGDATDTRFRSIRSAGDVDGDGCDDVLVQLAPGEAPEYLSSPDGPRYAAYLIYGELGGWGQTPGRTTLLYDYGHGFQGGHASIWPSLEPAAEIFDHLTLGALGDLDGDGFDDIGLTSIEEGQLNFRVVYGQDSGWGPSLADLPADRATQLLKGEADNLSASAAVRVASAADLDGDGSPEFIYGSRQSGYVGIFSEPVQWRGESRVEADFLDLADHRLTASYVGETGGIAAVSVVGDLNGDGYHDLYIASDHAPESGINGYAIRKYHLLYGTAVLPEEIDMNSLTPGQATAIVENGVPPFPSLAARGIGDVNGDGLDDVAFFGSHQGPWILFGDEQPAALVDLQQLNGGDGFEVTGRPWTYLGYDGFEIAAGDVNADGLSDVVIGSFAEFEGGGGGLAKVLLGHEGATAPAVDPDALTGEQGFVFSVPHPVGMAGVEQVAVADIDGDGVGDIVKTAIDAGDSGWVSTLHTVHGSSQTSGEFLVGGDYADEFTIRGPGSVYTLGGDDRVVLEPVDGAIDVHAGGGDDTVILSLGERSGSGSVIVDAGTGADNIILSTAVGVSGVRLGSTAVQLRGGPGADTYSLPRSGLVSGAVSIDDTSSEGGRNSLVLGFGYSASSIRLDYGSLAIGFADDGLEIHLENFDAADVLGGPRDIDTFLFADGGQLSYADLVARGFDLDGSEAADHLEGTSVTDRIRGLAGDDTLSGGDSDDLLVGGSGNDSLAGGRGNDIYLFDPGDGVDMLIDAAGHDAVRFGPGILSDDVVLARDGDDLSIQYGAEDRLLVGRWFGDESNRVELFEFSDGTVLTDSEIDGLLEPREHITGTADADQLWGTLSDDRIEVGAGNDVVYASSGNDHVRGGTGSDWVFGMDGDDLLAGGQGRDVLVGGEGSDEYRFGRGDGEDRIYNWSWSGVNEQDRLRFEADLLPDQLWFSREGYDLVAQVIGDEGRVTVSGWYYHDRGRVDRILAGRGDFITADRLEGLINAVATFNVPVAAAVELSAEQREAYSAIVASHWESPQHALHQMTA